MEEKVALNSLEADRLDIITVMHDDVIDFNAFEEDSDWLREYNAALIAEIAEAAEEAGMSDEINKPMNWIVSLMRYGEMSVRGTDSERIGRILIEEFGISSSLQAMSQMAATGGYLDGFGSILHQTLLEGLIERLEDSE